MNTRNDVTIISPNDKDELCAEFVIDDTSIPFVLNGVAQIGENYVLSFWMRSNSNALLKVGDTEILISTEWERYKFSFSATEESIKIYFNNKQNYYLYRAQLETGNVLTDWSPSPEDIKASLEVKIDTENLISEINASADVIRLTGDRIVIDSTYFKVEENGTVVARNMTITGTSQFVSEGTVSNDDYEGDIKVVISNGEITLIDELGNETLHRAYASSYRGDADDTLATQVNQLGIEIYEDYTKIVYLTKNGLYAHEDAKMNWLGTAEIGKNLKVNGNNVYGDKCVSLKTNPYSGETGRTISINNTMSRCQKGTGHVSIVEQYKVVIASSGIVAAGGILRLGTVPEQYFPSSRVAACFYVNESAGRMYSGNVNSDGTIEVRPSTEMGAGTYYIAISANYLLNASDIQGAGFDIITQPQYTQVAVGSSATFTVRLDKTLSNPQFVWQTSTEANPPESSSPLWRNARVYNPTSASGDSYTISSVTEAQDGLWVRCIINVDEETVVSDTVRLTTRKKEYKVTYNLQNCTSSNSSTTAIEKGSYQTEILINDGYVEGICTVTMAGKDITSIAVRGNNTIRIESVTGDIVINYSAIKNTNQIKITKQPQGVTVASTSKATFSIEAEGENLKFQWRVGTTQYAMNDYNATTTTANSSTLTIPAPNNRTDKYVKCIVSNDKTSVTSDVVKLDYL